jgi:hypothetical protein
MALNRRRNGELQQSGHAEKPIATLLEEGNLGVFPMGTELRFLIQEEPLVEMGNIVSALISN